MLEEHLKLYRCLAKYKVRYLVIGGVAAIIYGVPRATLDIDIFLEPELNNAEKFLKALKEAGFGTAGLTTPDKIVKNEVSVFNDRIRLDVLTKPRALDFAKAWRKRTVNKISGVKVVLASREDIIRCKNAVGRVVDKEDIKILKKV